MKKIIMLIVVGIAIAAGAAFAQDANVVADAGVTIATDAGVVTATVPDVGENPIGFIQQAWKSGKSGNGWMLASLVVIALVWGARKYATKIKWFQGDRGGALLAFSIAILGGLAHGTYVEGAPSLEMLTATFKVAFGAIGGYVGAKKIFFPSDKAKA